MIGYGLRWRSLSLGASRLPNGILRQRSTLNTELNGDKLTNGIVCKHL
jgi:hypothetical protein